MKRKKWAKFNHDNIKMALIQSGGNITLAGRILNLPKRSLYDKLDRNAELREYRDIVLKETIDYMSDPENIILHPVDGNCASHTDIGLAVRKEQKAKINEEIRQGFRKEGISEDIIKKSMIKNNGNITSCAKELKIDYEVLHTAIKESPFLSTVKLAMKQKIVDMAEKVIMEKLKEGDSRIAMFVLETQGKDQGYSKKVINELTGKDGTAIEVENKIVSIVKDANNTIDTILKGMI